MAIDPVKLALVKSTLKPKLAAYLAVEWDEDDAGETRYYSTQAYNNLAGYATIGHNIEARIIGDPFFQFELCPDLTTNIINITFDDIDREIRQRFKDFGSGVRCQIFFYFPDGDLTVPMWSGQLQEPQIYGWKTTETTATNGYRSRELMSPRRGKPKDHCAFTFGGHLPSVDAVRSNGCSYDRHLGGNSGLLNSGVPFTDCLRDEASCIARFGDNKSFGGFNTDASATVSDGRSGYIAQSKGNSSNLKTPHRVIFGSKHIMQAEPYLYRREPNSNTPDHGWYAGVWGLGEGPHKNIRNIKIKGKVIEALHISIRNGYRRQPAVANYNAGGTISNFSSTSHFSARYGWVNPANETPQSMPAECDVDGFAAVAVFNNTAAGNGIVGQYFLGDNFDTPMGERVDHNINFQSNVTPPIQGMENNDFSIRWQGFITPEFSETYTFECDHDDGVKVWIDDTLIIDQWGTIGTHTGNIALTANVPVSIRVDFFQSDSPPPHPWYCILKWQSTSQAKEVVPNSALTHNGSTGYVRQWTNDRVWCLMELYTNQTFGLCYPFSRFDTDSFVEASTWSIQTVNFALNSTDGETKNYAGRRTTFDAICEPRPSAEQLTDICRSGGLSVPFEYNGKFMMRTFRAATSDELNNAKVFYDKGDNRNILWQNGRPAITFTKTPNDKVVNEITLVFEAADNNDIERPITVDDPEQKRMAGRSLGDGNLQTVPMRFAAFGIRNLQEAVRLGYRALRFGLNDSGGTQNNGTLKMVVPLIEVIDMIRYDWVRVESEFLQDFTIGTDNGTDNWIETPEYFRVMSVRIIGDGVAEITAQAYNHSAYLDFETVTVPNPQPPSPELPSPLPPQTPSPCLPMPEISFNAVEGIITVNLPEC